MIVPARQTGSRRNGDHPSPVQEAKPPLRCAVYTRVSTDEQAALEFNSLAAQEEISKVYISMRAKDPSAERKWMYVETYSDAGYSGGTLDRPSLKRLFEDIQDGTIDVLVVYKIDRLSRSISQFYELWRILERRHYSSRNRRVQPEFWPSADIRLSVRRRSRAGHPLAPPTIKLTPAAYSAVQRQF